MRPSSPGTTNIPVTSQSFKIQSAFLPIMVKFNSIGLAIIAAVIPLAEARNCNNGLLYCGRTLLSIGNIAPFSYFITFNLKC